MFVHSSTDLLLSFRQITDHTSTLLESTKSQRKDQRKLLRTCNFSSAASPSPRGEPLKLQDSTGRSSPSCWEGPSLLFRARSVLKHTHTHSKTIKLRPSTSRPASSVSRAIAAYLAGVWVRGSWMRAAKAAAAAAATACR